MDDFDDPLAALLAHHAGSPAEKDSGASSSSVAKKGKS